MQKPAKKRIRSSNFSKEEELMLLREVEKQKHIIECKVTNKATNSEKEEAWKKVLSGLNGKNGETRSLEQIKVKYDNLKCKARKEVAKRKSFNIGTGGGHLLNIEVDPIVEATLNIINIKTLMGLKNKYDSDADSNQIEDDVKLNENLEPPRDNVEPCHNDLELNHDDVEKSQENNHVIEFGETPSTSTSTKGERRKSEASLSNGSREKSNWSIYCPQKLKRKTSDKLKPTVVYAALYAKGEYYKKKRELMEKTFEDDEKDRRRKRETEQEEHEKKMFLLDLDIRLKQKQLKDIY